MRVYVTTAFTAEPYESNSWVAKVFSSLTAAEIYVSEHSHKIQGEEPENLNYGYYISSHIEEIEVQD